MSRTLLHVNQTRREFLRHLFLTAGAAAAPGWLGACSDNRAGSDAAFRRGLRSADIGPLGDPDENGIRLPPGFKSRLVAVAGEPVPGPTGYVWHVAPDGGACFPAPDGGWVYVNNSEAGGLVVGNAGGIFGAPGGVGVLRFDAAGNLVDGYRVLDNTRGNCAGGPTPWGTWLSCEEVADGQVYECDPFGTPASGRVLPALGRFTHEAVAVDPVHRHLFMTEDDSSGRFYRFVPDAADWPVGAARPALAAGTLQAMEIVGGGAPASPAPVVWHDVPQPGQVPVSPQTPQATVFNGGEGLWYFAGVVYFSTKGDNRIWAYDTQAETVEVIYDFATSDNNILSGVDNLTVSADGDVLVAEDGGDMQLCVILPDRSVKPLLQVVGQDLSEITGPAFSPDGRRLYFNSQTGSRNGPGDGMTYEILLPD